MIVFVLFFTRLLFLVNLSDKFIELFHYVLLYAPVFERKIILYFVCFLFIEKIISSNMECINTRF